MSQQKSKTKTIPDDVDLLYKAVQNYVEKNNGKIIVIGGIATQEWPSDNAMVFHIAVKCTGRKPIYPATIPTGRQ